MGWAQRQSGPGSDQGVGVVRVVAGGEVGGRVEGMVVGLAEGVEGWVGVMEVVEVVAEGGRVEVGVEVDLVKGAQGVGG